MRTCDVEIVASLPLVLLLGLGGDARASAPQEPEGARAERPKERVAANTRELRIAVERAREWLARHQDEDGRWDADGFTKHDPPEDPSGGTGQPEHDVGVSGLALLALFGSDEHEAEIRRGLVWLRSQQDPASGLLGRKVGHAFLYNHGIASLALCEAHYFDAAEGLEVGAQRAVDYILSARNPYGAWRYDCPPVGDNDTSVTGWMVAALSSARDCALEVDPSAFDGARAWIDEATDPATGRVGYDSVGSGSSRVPGVNDRFPTDRTETMTASGMLSRLLMGARPDEDDVLQKHGDLVLRALPALEDAELTGDAYYLLHGTFAMYRMGGKHWEAWSHAVEELLLATQRTRGTERGSWDPDGPWGYAGGRVYSTAIGAICLEMVHRSRRTEQGYLYGSRAKR